MSIDLAFFMLPLTPRRRDAEVIELTAVSEGNTPSILLYRFSISIFYFITSLRLRVSASRMYVLRVDL
jgi:hypothetical protein